MSKINRDIATAQENGKFSIAIDIWVSPALHRSLVEYYEERGYSFTMHPGSADGLSHLFCGINWFPEQDIDISGLFPEPPPPPVLKPAQVILPAKAPAPEDDLDPGEFVK